MPYATVGILRPGAPAFVAVDIPTLGATLSRAAIRPLLADGRAAVPWAGVAFRVPLDANTYLTGWCDDDGHAHALPLTCFRWTADGDPLLGPIVLTREARDDDGDLLPLVAGDLARLVLLPVPGGPPVLTARDIYVGPGAAARRSAR